MNQKHLTPSNQESFFQDLEPGNIFTYSVAFRFKEVKDLAAKYGFACKSVSPLHHPKEYRKYGDRSVFLLDKSEEAHELTSQEMTQMFLSHLRSIIDYWANLPDKSNKERVSGVVFSTLVALDGGSATLPGFFVVPNPHHTDKEFHQERGENWWPSQSINDDKALQDSLHELFARMKE